MVAPRIVALACLTAFAASSAMAQHDTTAFALYEAGDYQAAAASASEQGGPANLALAARALNAEAYFTNDRKSARRIADRGLDYAEAALEADPTLVEAHLQAAICLALRGANMSPARAFFLNLPGRARRFIDRAIELDPENAWAYSTSAAWRLEVSRRGGGVYGADPEQGYREFRIARTLDPENIAISYECALRLIASGRAEWRATAFDCLDMARSNAPVNAFEAGVRERADALSNALAAGPEATAEFIEMQP